MGYNVPMAPSFPQRVHAHRSSPSAPRLPLRDLRRRLHALAELSGAEEATAAFMAEHLDACGPSRLVTGLGGRGVAAVFASVRPHAGPTLMFRAELDALPIDETLDLPHASFTPGVAHKCGHDGHLAVLAGLARELAVRPPQKGRCILLCQPAEETGTGAAAVVRDPAFADLRPDWAFALHNLPGFAQNTVLVHPGPFAAASCGLTVRLNGRTSHAAYPEQGRSPDRAVAELLLALVNLPDPWRKQGRLALVTVVHARLGERAFGVSPGEAEILATLRADDETVLQELKAGARAAARRTAARHHLGCTTAISEEFPALINHPQAAAAAADAARSLGLRILAPQESPFRWSEDFGALARLGKGALVGLGAGLAHPALHAQDFDFNDRLLPTGVRLWTRLCRSLLGPRAA